MRVTTVASNEVVHAGSAIYDRIRTKGVRGVVKVELYGPFASRAGIRCTGRAVWTGRVTVRADGEIRSPVAHVLRPGFYVFRERVLTSSGATRLVTACAIQAETSLVAPKIIAGKGDQARYTPMRGVGAATPARVRLTSLGIDAPIAPVGIDTRLGALGVPTTVHRAGWWRDGIAAGSDSGAILIAGHVDSAVQGAGVFYKLHLARAGDRVELVTAAGGLRAYRVVSVRSYPKAALPTGVWSRKGRARLVLVTCGGPFDQKTGHYRDNVVVTAVPA